MVAVFFEHEDENKSCRLIGLVQWRTKRAPDHLRVGVGGGVLVAVFIEPEDENKSVRLIGLVQWRIEKSSGSYTGGGRLQVSLNPKMRINVVG